VIAYQGERQLDALGDGTRRAIFERLAAGPLAVAQIASSMPVSRPAVSQHLKVLKEAHLVIDRAEGTRRVYQHDKRGLLELKSYLEKFWGEALDAFVVEAEASFVREQPPTRSKRKNQP
jgi:DNA-binding transcriptional ArsR family regulator